MSYRPGQTRRLERGQYVYLRARVLEADFTHPFDTGKFSTVQLVDAAGKPIDEVQHVVPTHAPITAAEAVKAVTGV